MEREWASAKSKKKTRKRLARYLGEGVQLDVVGSIFAQFDLGTPSYDLLNSDFVVGFPITMRRGGFSSRLRIYHQSSHLGDEFLLANRIQRVNLSYEGFDLKLSYELFGDALRDASDVRLRED